MSFLKLDEFIVPGYGLKADLVLPLKDEDASGESSGTARAGKGDKAKKLEVRLSLAFKYADRFGELVRIAEAKAGGAKKVYTITNDTANAAGMRQGVFSGNFRATPKINIRAWDISFTLAEKNSVPEMVETRQAQKEAAPQTNDGREIAPEPTQNETPPADQEDTGLIENVLKYLNDTIGDEETAE